MDRKCNLRGIGLACGVAVLGVSLVSGCARQPQYQVGEWMAGNSVVMAFSQDGTFAHLTMDPGGNVVKRGSYKMDYSKDPIQLDVFFNDNTVRFAIVRFIGEGHQKMEVAYSREGNRRPVAFGDDRAVASFLLRKTRSGT